jgi:hypothetical protein
MMRHAEFEAICKDLGKGSERRVKHIVLHQSGKVIACRPDDFVEIEMASGEHKTWSKDNITLLN